MRAKLHRGPYDGEWIEVPEPPPYDWYMPAPPETTMLDTSIPIHEVVQKLRYVRVERARVHAVNPTVAHYWLAE